MARVNRGDNNGRHWTENNALARRDLWILLPVLVMVGRWLYNVPFGVDDIRMWIAWVCAMLLGIAMLSTAIFYSRWAALILTGFLGSMVLVAALEYAAGTDIRVSALLGQLPLGVLSGVLLYRRYSRPVRS